MTTMKYIFGIVTTLTLFFSFNANANEFVPEKTYALIIGVLHWQDPELTSFPQENRKDRQFKDLLVTRKVPAENIAYLEDEKASLAEIRKSLSDLLKRAPEGSTFLFYFAGHGLNTENGVILANHDIRMNALQTTGFYIHELEKEIKAHFKGETALFFADCCYSGALVDLAFSLGKIKVGVITSVVKPDLSTHLWTFTEALISIFSGAREVDENKDGVIEFSEAARFVTKEMLVKEEQTAASAHSNLFSEKYIFYRSVVRNYRSG